MTKKIKYHQATRIFLFMGLLSGIISSAILLVICVFALQQGSYIPSIVLVAFGIGGALSICNHILAFIGGRRPWAFAITANGTCALFFFFGAPTLASAIETNLAIAFIPCFLFILATIFMAAGEHELRNP